jgi:cytochrome c oxidase subunit 2
MRRNAKFKTVARSSQSARALGLSVPQLFFSLAALILFAGCSGNQSALNPVADQARDISHLWWLFCIVMTVIYLLVQIFFVWGITKRAPKEAPPVLNSDVGRERKLTWLLGIFIGVTAIILLVFMINDFFTGQHMRKLDDPHPLRILVTGHQWWWEIQYEDDTPSNIVVTANEIHIPTGKAVQFDLQSADVIHSFWSPNFDGKKDLVPGHPTSLWFRATRTGNFFGQCAEFCGLQHAHMRFEIVVDTPERFQSWLSAQNQSAPSPANDLQKHGQQVFLNGSCILCHTISGTPARGTIGPDLSHLASRQMIAAGTLFNTRGHLGGWILDAPRIKPGTHMPQNNLSPSDFQALLAYLESLK